MKRCLIVDFSEVVRNVARRIFEPFKFEPSKPESGRDALDLCAKSPELSSPSAMAPTTENDPTDIAKALRAGSR